MDGMLGGGHRAYVYCAYLEYKRRDGLQERTLLAVTHEVIRAHDAAKPHIVEIDVGGLVVIN